MSDEITELKKKVRVLEKELRKLKNHVMHSPHVLKIFVYIQKRGVCTLDDIRNHFPHVYGGTLTRLYLAVRTDERFRIVQSKSRWSPTVFAFFGDSEKPSTPSLMAVDYFQRTPKAYWRSTTTAKGRKTRILSGKQGTLRGIVDTYNIDLETAKAVFNEIIRLFGSRIKLSKVGKAFRRLY